MVSLLNLAFSNEFNLATFVVGLLSLGGVIINIIVTANNNKKKRYKICYIQRGSNKWECSLFWGKQYNTMG